MSNLLASVYDGDAEPLRRLVEDEKANVWARAAAAHTFIVLVATGQMAHDDVARYIGELFAGRLPRTSSFLWDSLADVVAHLPIRELLGAVKQTFDEGLQEDHPSAFKYIEQDAAMSPAKRAQLMNERYDLVGSAIDEMSWWAALDKDERQHSRRVAADEFVGNANKESTTVTPDSSIPSRPAASAAGFGAAVDRSTTVWSSGQPMRTELKTGRNDPCPCGSGKKFKKCCLIGSGSPG